MSRSRPKATPEEIRARFDRDVERFSNLATGQTATVDASLVLELLTATAALAVPEALSLLDIGCGAGNYSLKLLEKLPGLKVTLLDLSLPMLQRAQSRIQEVTSGAVATFLLQGDVREVELGQEGYDIVLAGMVLHHLREEEEWREVFGKLYGCLKPGGFLGIADLVEPAIPAARTVLWEHYSRYLLELGGPSYRDQVFDYIAWEDTPRSLTEQLGMLRQQSFSRVEVLHARSVFATFCAIK